MKDNIVLKVGNSSITWEVPAIWERACIRNMKVIIKMVREMRRGRL